MRPGQTLNSKLGFFQPSRTCLKLGLTLEATPLMEVSSRAVYVLFNNCTAQDIHVPKANHLGWLISQAFHDFELMVPVIGPIPTQLMSDEYDDTVTFTKPHEVIAITSILPVSRESVCRSDLTDDTHLAVYAVSTQPATESPTQVTIGAQSPSNYLTAEEPYTGFNAQVQQILSEADALHNEADRQGLKEVLHKYKDSFTKDSLDCGLTNIHTVCVPTNPNAPPTFVRQYKIPIASYEPVQEIVDSMLEKGVIRPCNSTYSAPIWPVLNLTLPQPKESAAASHRSSHGLDLKDLDKLARNIGKFTPSVPNSQNVQAYLQDIDFHLEMRPNVTDKDRLYLLRTTSSSEVRSFLDRQPAHTKNDYQLLREALIKEFSDPESEQGLVAALETRQGRHEPPQAYYSRLRWAYFGTHNEPDMEDELNFNLLTSAPHIGNHS